jgi:hypothetical protein
MFRKWRAILGTGVAGAGVGALLAGVVLGVSGLIAPGSVPLIVALGGPLAMGAFGFFAAGGFATMLALRDGGTSLDGLSISKSGFMGLAAGFLFPAVSAVLTGGLLFPLELQALTVAGGFFGVMGAGITAGLVAVAKDHESAELGEGKEAGVLPGA